MKKLIRQMFVSFVYADHNSSNRIKRKLTELLNEVRVKQLFLILVLEINAYIQT